MKKTMIFVALLALITAAAAEPTIQEYQSPSVKVSGNTLTVQLFIKNVGSAMTTPYLVEIQPRPQGSLPLSVTAQDVCDPTIPTSVHVQYLLGAGEQGIITLTTPLPPGTYDVYVLGRSKCYNTPPVGNVVQGPWGYYKLAAGSVPVLGGQSFGLDLPVLIGIGLIIIAFFLFIAGRKR